MTIEEAIDKYIESEKINMELAENSVSAMAKSHNLDNAEKCRQMVEWLRELAERRKADSCEGCMHRYGERLTCQLCARYYFDKYVAERKTDK